MNQKITFPELVSALSKTTGMSKYVCEEFLKEFFATISSTLANDESVKIKQIGTFKVSTVEPRKSVNVSTGEEIEIPGHKKVTFTPDKSLAEAVNAPFAAFETVEINDNVTDEMLDLQNDDSSGSTDNLTQDNSESATIAEDSSEVHEEPADNSTNNLSTNEPADEQTEDNLSVADQTATVIYDITEEEHDNEDATNDELQEDAQQHLDAEAIEETPKESENSDEAITDDTDDADVETEHEAENDRDNSEEEINSSEEYEEKVKSHKKNSRFIPGFAWGILTGIVIAGAATAGYYILTHTESATDTHTPDTEETLISQSESVKTDTIKSDSIKIEMSADEIAKVVKTPETKPSDSEVVYDTISLTRFLTTMARHHYGNYHFWAYIYEENKAILGHPDRIPPGTRVVIPPASKYGIDANDKKCIEEAKRKGVEIYSKYNKK